MPRIEPMPLEQIDHDIRVAIDEGSASGMYTQTLPLQIMAYSRNAFFGMDASYKAVFGKSLLGQRIQELVRLTSAQLNGCDMCSQSRKDDSLTEDDVACLLDPQAGGYTPRERMAVRAMHLMATDHDAIDDDVFHELAEIFTTAEIIELLWTCSRFLGSHRLMHALDILADREPVIQRNEPLASKTG